MRRRRDDRGAVVVETAIVTPVFFLVLFAILEFGLLLRDYLSITDAVADSARIGAVVGPDLTGAGGTADFEIVRTLRDGLAALDADDIERIVVFRGAPSTAGSPDDQVPSACVAGFAQPDLCNVYDPAAAFAAVETGDVDYFRCIGSGDPACAWDPAGRSDGPRVDEVDYVGVWVRIDRPAATGLFRDRWSISNASVLRLEPGPVE